MSSIQVPNTDKPTQTVALIDPATGLALGTAAAPLQTATSNLQTTADLTRARNQISTATTTAVVAATAAVRTRVYRMRLNVAGANVLEIRDGATVLEILNFTGAAFLTYDFATRPWYTGSVNTAFNFVTSTTAVINYVLEYTLAA